VPFAMIEVANKICEAIPSAIVDFDITEGERAVGLAFLEAGKFFAVNKTIASSSRNDRVNSEFDWLRLFY
jgi:hypothetical protein